MDSEVLNSVVRENYLRWKGEPAYIHRREQENPHVSPFFSVFEYTEGKPFSVFCTLGASHKIIPQSKAKFKETDGVRYEYIMHGLSEHAVDVCELLFMISEYPFLQNKFIYSGFILPLGTNYIAVDDPKSVIVEGSKMEFLYFTYPYEDDTRIYTPPCWGEISLSSALIQTLWVFPIHRSEALYAQKKGLDAFEELLSNRGLQAHDFFRESLV